MNIKITNADFSANGDNLGREELRTAPNSTTQAVLDYYSKTWTLAQELAIEDFLTKKSAWTFASKIERLILPILASNTTILKDTVAVKGFYDLQTETIPTLAYGASYTDDRFIGANGFYDSTSVLSSANAFLINLLTPTSWNDVGLSIYFQKTINVSETIAVDIGITNISIAPEKGRVGNAPRVTANFDPNSFTNRGLRSISWDGTNMTGLSADLPFASVVGDSVDSAGDMNLVLLSRTNAINDVTISLISRHRALTQDETVIFNADVNELMDALWTV